ncbi:hypothetical protein [Labrenzia sp. R5_0]|nr:hypothetical protein [Labrenzia sp. R5_0]
MSVLLLAFEPAPVAASMAIDKAGATADAVHGHGADAEDGGAGVS